MRHHRRHCLLVCSLLEERYVAAASMSVAVTSNMVKLASQGIMVRSPWRVFHQNEKGVHTLWLVMYGLVLALIRSGHRVGCGTDRSASAAFVRWAACAFGVHHCAARTDMGNAQIFRKGAAQQQPELPRYRVLSARFRGESVCETWPQGSPVSRHDGRFPSVLLNDNGVVRQMVLQAEVHYMTWGSGAQWQLSRSWD